MLGAGACEPGLYVLGTEQIFAAVSAFPGMTVSVSFFEIYGDEIMDLLNNRNKLQAREDAQHKVHVTGLVAIKVGSAKDVRFSQDEFNVIIRPCPRCWTSCLLAVHLAAPEAPVRSRSISCTKIPKVQTLGHPAVTQFSKFHFTRRMNLQSLENSVSSILQVKSNHYFKMLNISWR